MMVQFAGPVVAIQVPGLPSMPGTIDEQNMREALYIARLCRIEGVASVTLHTESKVELMVFALMNENLSQVYARVEGEVLQVRKAFGGDFNVGTGAVPVEPATAEALDRMREELERLDGLVH